jgi:hypothetical protein
MIKPALIAAFAAALVSACDYPHPSSDQIQAASQERMLLEGTAQTGMPAITNFRERKTLKMIYELRDKENLNTYAYIVAQQTGELRFLCNSIGFAISDATGYTNPEKIIQPRNTGTAYMLMRQAEPNGLYTPDVSAATWVVCVDPKTGKLSPLFVGPDVVVSPFKLDAEGAKK